jgi:hypothetical protein
MDILLCRRSRSVYQSLFANLSPFYLFACHLTYGNVNPKQQMYHVPQQRPQDPSVGQDAGHNYPRHDGGEGDADAEGERDYEVG